MGLIDVELDENGNVCHNVESLSYGEIKDMYEDVLDEIYPDQTAFGVCVTARDYRETLDPIGFRCEVSDWSSENFVEHPIIGYCRKEEHESLQDELESLKSYLEDDKSDLEDEMLEDLDDNEIEEIKLKISEIDEKIENIEEFQN